MFVLLVTDEENYLAVAQKFSVSEEKNNLRDLQ